MTDHESVTSTLDSKPEASKVTSTADCRASDAATDTDNDDEYDSVCAVCLQEMIHPVRLPCTHIFCFLCLKGVTLTRGYLCPLCRGNIPAEFLKQPTLVTPPPAKHVVVPVKAVVVQDRRSRRSSSSNGCRTRSQTQRSSSTDAATAGGGDRSSSQNNTTNSTSSTSGSSTSSTSSSSPAYQWFYEGRNGWWRYDARTNEELEAAHVAEEENLTMLLAGHNFTIDLLNMTQCRADGGGLTRNIKRDSPLCQAKGTAGLHSSTLAKAEARRYELRAQHKKKKNDT
uniref:E3 ubiquitin-protein ligase n=1 Tax=Hirondellea gigas TaxID=1518452 RepID=A0A2P2I327_9CRUS